MSSSTLREKLVTFSLLAFLPNLISGGMFGLQWFRTVQEFIAGRRAHDADVSFDVEADALDRRAVVSPVRGGDLQDVAARRKPCERNLRPEGQARGVCRGGGVWRGWGWGGGAARGGAHG